MNTSRARNGMGIALMSLVSATAVLAQPQATTSSTQSTTQYSSTDRTVRGDYGYSGDTLNMGRWSGGSTVGMLGSTPDGTAFALNANAEYFIDEQLSVGPLLQLGFTDDLNQIGLSGQGKYWIDVPNTGNRGKIFVQAGLGFVHADFLRDDTSWLIPLGVGYDHTLDSGVSLSAASILNFTDLNTGFGTDADVMPGFAFGVRF